MSFERQAALYIDFIEYLISQRNMFLDMKELAKLWNCYFEEGICEQHINILIKLLLKEYPYPNLEQKYLVFNNKLAKVFFNEVLCKNVSALVNKITQIGLTCFINYANLINDISQFEAKQSIFENYLGLSVVLIIAFDSEKESIREDAIDFIVSIIEKFCRKHKTKRKEIIESSFKNILTQAKDNRKIKIAVKMIISIIEK